MNSLLIIDINTHGTAFLLIVRDSMVPLGNVAPFKRSRFQG